MERKQAAAFLLYLELLNHNRLFPCSPEIPYRGSSNDSSAQAWDDPQIPLHQKWQHAVR